MGTQGEGVRGNKDDSEVFGSGNKIVGWWGSCSGKGDWKTGQQEDQDFCLRFVNLRYLATVLAASN